MERPVLGIVLTIAALGAFFARTPEALAQVPSKVTHGGTVSGGNSIYTVYVQDQLGSGIGQYTATTGANHPAGSGLNLLFGSGEPGTSYNTIRSYTSGVDYIQPPGTGFTSTNTVISLDPYGTTVALGTTGARTTYVLPGPPTTPDALTIVQDVNVNGATFGNSTIEVTTRVTNNGTSPVAIGIRYFWDFQIGVDDGPTFQQLTPNGSVLTNETTFTSPEFQSFQIIDNDGNPNPPTFAVQGTVLGPATIVPTPTAPDQLEYVSWPNSFGQAFDYQTNSALDISTGAGIDDSAGTYFFGHNSETPIIIQPSATTTVSASMFATPPVATPALGLSPSTGTNNVAQTHSVTALATLNITPVSGVTVSFTVTGANTTSGSCVTGADGTCIFTYTGVNPGQDTINAQATINDQTVNATPVSETWAAPASPATLTLSPREATNVVGQVHVVTATAGINNAAAQNVTVTFVVTGANPTNGLCITGTNGTCQFSYTGIFAGTDLITASATIGDSSLQATANKVWLPSESQSQTFTSSTTPETKIYTVGQPTDPAAQSLALTVATVINPIIVTVEFHYEPTELLTEHNGVGVADGICERSLGATESTDFDCRLADGGFVYQTLANGDQVVPHIIPSHNNFGVWVRVIATIVSNGQPAVAGTDYTGPVEWYYAWNTNPPLIPSSILGAPVSTASTTNFVNPEYAPGWNNLNPQIFDRHGDDPDIAFKFNITTYAKFNCNPTCVGTADPGIGGKTPTFNDVVAADIPNPPTGQADVFEPVVPNPRISPFPYVAGLPMLVAFELEKTGTETPDTTAVTFPHNVSAAVLDPATGLPVAVPTFPGFPKTYTYNPFLKLYYVFLSPAPLTPGKTYQLQINSDLFPKPVNANIVVRKSFF